MLLDIRHATVISPPPCHADDADAAPCLSADGALPPLRYATLLDTLIAVAT